MISRRRLAFPLFGLFFAAQAFAQGGTAAPAEIKVDNERAKYWLGVGAQPTDTVRILLKKTGAIEEK